MVKCSVNGKTLTIVADIGPGERSASGKSLVVATTNGFIAVDGSDIRVSLNVIRK